MKRAIIILPLICLLLVGCGNESETELTNSNRELLKACSVMYSISYLAEETHSLTIVELALYDEGEEFSLVDRADDYLNGIDKINKALGLLDESVFSGKTTYKDVYTNYNDYTTLYVRSDEIYRLLLSDPNNETLIDEFMSIMSDLDDSKSSLENCIQSFFREYCYAQDVGLCPPHDTQSIDEEEVFIDSDDSTETSAIDPTADLSDVTFIANTSSLIYHKKDCSHVSNISKDNILYWCDTEDKLIQAGFKPCSDCLMLEEEETSEETTSEGTPIIHEYNLKSVFFIDTPESSVFNRIGYAEDNNDIVVDFETTGLYVYHDVPSDVWDDFVDADSKGGFYQQNIKGQFDCEKLDLN